MPPTPDSSDPRIAKYRPAPRIALPERRWPDRVIERAPIWCSVDLRDGNQALIEPMGPERKQRMFDALVELGFREIEVGFPAASETDFAFLRHLIDDDRIPQSVTIQVLTQARQELIERTFEAIRGAPRAIVHLYNSTSEVQRRVVFGLDRPGIIDIAVRGAELVRDGARTAPEVDVRFEYSPESFTQTEPEFAVEICEAVMDVWEPTAERRVILNLPATVEVSQPNLYADQIEWFGAQIRDRESVILSVHPHNDRGTAVAAAELAQLAGAERVEGTLFGNGERTGNVDVVTLALNLLTQGVDPGLAIRDINELIRVAEYCNRLPVDPRHPYAGELVFTAFSGSHQDAINKGFGARKREREAHRTDPDRGERRPWEVPYLPIDPADLGRTYDALVRINSQSGKGGIAYVLEHDHGLQLPRRLQIEFSRRVQEIADETGEELSSKRLFDAFHSEFLDQTEPLAYVDHTTTHPSPPSPGKGAVDVAAVLRFGGETRELHGHGNGPIAAFVDALRRELGAEFRVSDYREHAVGAGADAAAVAYVEIVVADGGALFGVGRNSDIVRASLEAVLSAVNRAHAQQRLQLRG